VVARRPAGCAAFNPSIAGAEGRCLSRCLPEVAAQAGNDPEQPGQQAERMA
jgi:hypothetical protein